MSTRTTIITVFVLGLICGVMIALMWAERNTPDKDTTRAEWRRDPMATRRSA